MRSQKWSKNHRIRNGTSRECGWQAEMPLKSDSAATEEWPKERESGRGFGLVCIAMYSLTCPNKKKNCSEVFQVLPSFFSRWSLLESKLWPFATFSFLFWPLF